MLNLLIAKLQSISNYTMGIKMTPSELLPATQRAIVQAAEAPPGTLEVCENRPLPDILPNQVMVKVAAVALNPCDWKMPTNMPCPGAVDGSDYSGTIVKVGEAVTSDLQIGDRVAGAQHASNPLNPRSGAFTEYVAVFQDQLWKVPDHMAWDEAAALGWAVVGSVGLALFKALKLPGSPEEPVKKPMYALVYGGATASGTIAIQLLKL
jgi:NADPH:quinone reductase-like Zn-dependent oxidoreductase